MRHLEFDQKVHFDHSWAFADHNASTCKMRAKSVNARLKLFMTQHIYRPVFQSPSEQMAVRCKKRELYAICGGHMPIIGGPNLVYTE